jgi:hypothetical protein
VHEASYKQQGESRVHIAGALGRDMVDPTSLIYRSGDAFLPASVTQFLMQYWVGNDTSLFYVNNWSLVHFTSGILTGVAASWLNWTNPLLMGLVIHTLWEIWQIVIGMTRLNVRGAVDITMDTIWFMTGLWLAVKVAKSDITRQTRANN